MKKFIVTGGAGFIGSNFINYLHNNEENYITNIDKLSYGSNLNNIEVNSSRYKLIEKSIGDNLMNIINDTDYIINFAAESHVDRSIANPKNFTRQNINGVLNLLENIRKSKNDPILISIGTDEEYGDTISGSFSEDDMLKPSSPYSASKASSSLLALSYFKTYGIKVIVTRTSNNFGKYQFPEKLIPKTIIRNLLHLDIELYGNGQNTRDWIYVIDNVKAILTVLNKGKYGEIYNISSSNELKNVDIVNRIFDIMQIKGKINYVSDRPGHDVRYSINSSKIKNLGWKPEFTFDDALKLTVDWYMNNEKWWKPLINDNVLSGQPWKLKWN